MVFIPKTDRKESANKTIRFSREMIERIEEQAREFDVSFSSFVVQACEYALDDIAKDPGKHYRPSSGRDPGAGADKEKE